MNQTSQIFLHFPILSLFTKMQNVYTYFFNEKQKCLCLLFNEKQKCLYRVFNENTKCLLFHFLNALFSGLFAQKLSHLFYLRTIVLHVFQIILFHGLILHFFFIEPLSCFSLRCKQHCLILWRKYLIKTAG